MNTATRSKKAIDLGDEKPIALQVNHDGVPDSLKRLDRWVCWRYIRRPNKQGVQKWTKRPIIAKTGRSASSTDPATWSTFEAAIGYYRDRQDVDGVGLVLGDGLMGIDLDDAIVDGRLDELSQWAVDKIDSYTEVSPSATGLKAFVFGHMPDLGRNRNGNFEAYDRGRFFAVTGRPWPGSPIVVRADCQGEIDEVCERLLGSRGEPQAERPRAPANGTHDLDALALLAKARAAANGSKFTALFDRGDCSAYESASEADSALACLLLFWVRGDISQADRLFRQSALMRPKWDEIHSSTGETYGSMTLSRAAKVVTAYYDPQQGKSNGRPTFGRSSTTSSAADDAPEPQSGAKASGVTNGLVVDDKVVPLPMGEILRGIKDATGDWPRRVGSALFVDDGRVSWLSSCCSLFGYLASQTGIVRWHRSMGCCTKEEVYSELCRTATDYIAVEELPHEPPIGGHYYACGPVAPGDGRTLRQLLDRFKPASPIDRDLILAMFATVFWGGPSGARPAFVIVSKHGRGVGKSKLAAALGLLAGGALDVAADEGAEVLKQRLLSPDGISKRLVVVDNVKSRRFSRAELESIITAPAISGRRLYVGEARRPNTVSYIITLNGIALSTDLAQRSIIVELDRPDRSGTWEEQTFQFIEANRQLLIADAVGFLRGPRAELARYSRWASWERDVLARLPEPNDAQQVILERQGMADVEDEEADVIEAYFADRLRRLGYLPDTSWIRVPVRVAAAWYAQAIGEPCRVTSASRALGALIDEGKLSHLRRDTGRRYGRNFLWVGPGAAADGCVLGDLESRLASHGDRPERF